MATIALRALLCQYFEATIGKIAIARSKRTNGVTDQGCTCNIDSASANSVTRMILEAGSIHPTRPFYDGWRCGKRHKRAGMGKGAKWHCRLRFRAFSACSNRPCFLRWARFTVDHERKDSPVATTVRQLAELVGGTVVGDGALLVKSARILHEAEADDITFLDSASQVLKLQASRASAAVVPIGLIPTGK